MQTPPPRMFSLVPCSSSLLCPPIAGIRTHTQPREYALAHTALLNANARNIIAYTHLLLRSGSGALSLLFLAFYSPPLSSSSLLPPTRSLCRRTGMHPQTHTLARADLIPSSLLCLPLAQRRARRYRRGVTKDDGGNRGSVPVTTGAARAGTERNGVTASPIGPVGPIAPGARSPASKKRPGVEDAPEVGGANARDDPGQEGAEAWDAVNVDDDEDDAEDAEEA